MCLPRPNKRLRFREWKEEDFEFFAWMNRDKEVMEFFPSILAYEETIKWMQQIRKHF
jgi:RimJ/RimL family protein N-acetyltransferase